MIHPERSIGAVTLNVQNLTAVRDFYVHIVGLHVCHASAEGVDLGVASATLVRLRELKHGHSQPKTPGLYHLALRVPQRQALAHWLRHYATRGAPYWQGASDHGVSDALYLTDPEGNGIEIYHDHPRSRWVVDAEGRIMVQLNRLNVDALIQEAPEARWQGLPPQTDMGHIHLTVNSLAAARGFYVALLGFGVKTVHQDSALFVAGGNYHHHIGLNTWRTLGVPPRTAKMYGLAEFVIQLDHAAEHETIRNQLTAANYAFQTAGADTLVWDPSGNCVRIQTISG